MTADMADTLTEMLRATIDEPGVGVRFLDRHERADQFTFSQIWERALASAGFMRAHGVRQGDRVAIVVPTDIAFYDAFFGALCAGATPVPMYPPVRLGRLDEWVERTARMLRAVKARAIVADPRTRKILGNIVHRVEVPCGVFHAEALSGGSPVAPDATSPDDLALIQFSSGTTRQPTPIPFTHRQLLANVDAILGALPQEAVDDGAGVSWLPLYHDMGLVGCVFTALRGKGPLTLLPPELFLARPAMWLRALSKYRGTVSPAPNFAFARCVDKIRDDEIADVDLSAWVVAMNGAEPISADVMRAFVERFSDYGLRASAMTPVYGLAEAALAVTFSPIGRRFQTQTFDRDGLSRGVAAVVGDDDENAVELTSVGTPLPRFGVEVRDDSGARAPDGRVGRIWIRGPSLTSGYLGGRDAPITDGWLDTGDVGFVHDEALYVSGRAKDVVVVRGRNHAPVDLERPCDRVAGVRTGCTVAVSDVDADGEHVLVFVESRDPTDDLAGRCCEEIRAACGVEPDLVLVLQPGTLPRTSSGKLRRREALRRFKRGELAPPRDVTATFIAGAMARSLVGYLRAR